MIFALSWMARIHGGTMLLSSVENSEGLGILSQDLQFKFKHQGRIKNEYFNFYNRCRHIQVLNVRNIQVYFDELPQSKAA
jgi:hypothetical protein